MFDFGKHKGKTFQEVHQEDPEYFLWFMQTFHKGLDWIGQFREELVEFLRHNLTHKDITEDQNETNEGN